MRRLEDVVSPVSWMLMSIAVVVSFWVILHPTLTEFAIMLAVDVATRFAFSPLDLAFFTRTYPDTARYLRGISKEDVQRLDVDQQVQLLESFRSFPGRRAAWAYFGACIKGLPAMIIVVLVWKHPHSNLRQLLLVAGICAVNFCYFYAAVFLESHIFLTRQIARLHHACDLSEAFARLRFPSPHSGFEQQEAVNLAFFILFTLGLQGAVVLAGQYHNPHDLALRLASIGLAGMTLFLHLWMLGRNYFVGGLHRIFRELEQPGYPQTAAVLPLHSSPLLARFETTFNVLTRRLVTSELELSSLVFAEAEKSRYRALGEMSALIAHDLSGPLHVAQFCADQLLEIPSTEDPRTRRYLEPLAANLRRAAELITSLRARIKNPEHSPTSAKLSEAHQHVLRLLETQFPGSLFRKVEITLDPELDALELELQRVDLIHILDNIYRNSIQNFIQHSIAKPRLAVDLHGSSDDATAEILIRDNGTGLAATRFEELTSPRSDRPRGGGKLQGLGLRLTRRLVEMNGGELRILNPKHGNLGGSLGDHSLGTSFCLILKRKAPSENP